MTKWLQDWFTLLRLGRRRFRSDADYFRFQFFQGKLVLRYLERQGIGVSGLRVLDLASGNGGYSRALADARGRVVSIDLQPPAMMLPMFLVGNAMQLPFASQSFDLVFCASLIEHVPDPARLMAEIRRVLVHDGCVYLSFPPFYSPVGGHQFKPYHLLGECWALRLSKHKAASFSTSFGGFGLYPLSIRRVRELIAEAEFEIRHQSTRFLPFDVSRIPLLGEFLTWHAQFLLGKQA
jgi:SAM-dependent methyltransferase